MTDIVHKVGGWRPEPPSDTDWKFDDFRSHAISAPSVTVDLRLFCSPVEHQGQTNSCTGNAAIGGLEVLEAVQGLPHVDLSRLFGYYNGRQAMDPPEGDKDEGTYIRLVMKGLSTFGVCPESDWPFDADSVTVRPSWSAYRTAFGHKVNAYYKIDGTGEYRLQAIEDALRSFHPVVFGTRVYRYFQATPPQVRLPRDDDTLDGAHAMLIVGFDQANRVLIVRNSWGPSWADRGYCYMPYEYLDAAGASDFWVPTKY
jgi:C1A family cysteine protease